MGGDYQQGGTLYADKRILILGSQENWLQTAESILRERGCNFTIQGHTTLDGLATLVKEGWDLIVMPSVGAISGQKHPLEAIAEWKKRGGVQPIVIVSPLPTPTEARDALYNGAVYYAKMPWNDSEFTELLDASFKEVLKRTQTE